MMIIFCSDPMKSTRVDSDYEREFQAATQEGWTTGLICFEKLVDEGLAEKAVLRIPEQTTPTVAIYRGWMMPPAQYEQLYNALVARNVRLINTPEQYRHCHYLPESYHLVERRTPKTTWLNTENGFTEETIAASLAPFGDRPVILKDFVKSQKHYWTEACFIPSASDTTAAVAVVRRFLDLVDQNPQGGLVFREYVDLEPIGIHPASGMPLTLEFRVFQLRGVPVCVCKYWDEAEYPDIALPHELLSEVGGNVRSPFFTVDIAKLRSGGWIVIEVGDGQVSGLPENADPAAFYRSLHALVR